MAKTDSDVGKRLDHLINRCTEELYDLEKDPHALNNLIDNPEYASVVKTMRNEMEAWMIETNDYMLPAFQADGNVDKLNAFMADELAQAEERCKIIQWKRFKNSAGGTGKNKDLYKVR